MVQAAMYFALGVLTTGLLALLVMPAVWRRTARLTRQRIERSVPLTMAEIQADRDQLRAEFAITARKLEMAADRLRDKATEQIIEINEKRAEIVRLTNEGDDKTRTIEGLEERAARLVEDLAAADERLSKASERIGQHEATLAQRGSEITELRTRLSAVQELADAQKLELVARDTEIGNLNDRLSDANTTEQGLIATRDKLAEELAAEQSALAGERRRAANLEGSLARLEAERIDRLGELERRAAEARELITELARSRTTAEDLAARVTELEAERAAKNRETERQIAEIAALRTDNHYDNGMPREHGGGSPDGDNVAKAIAAAEEENALLSQRLAALEAEHESLLAQNEQLRRIASAEWDIELENALLRERLAGVAAEVLQLTKSFDGAAQHHGEKSSNGSGNGEQPPNGPTAPPAEVSGGAKPLEGATLAQRLRALQDTAVRH